MQKKWGSETRDIAFRNRLKNLLNDYARKRGFFNKPAWWEEAEVSKRLVEYTHGEGMVLERATSARSWWSKGSPMMKPGGCKCIFWKGTPGSLFCLQIHRFFAFWVWPHPQGTMGLPTNS